MTRKTKKQKHLGCIINDPAMESTHFLKCNKSSFIKPLSRAQYRVSFVPGIGDPAPNPCLPLYVQSTVSIGLKQILITLYYISISVCLSHKTVSSSREQTVLFIPVYSLPSAMPDVCSTEYSLGAF